MIYCDQKLKISKVSFGYSGGHRAKPNEIDRFRQVAEETWAFMEKTKKKKKPATKNKVTKRR